MRGACTSEPGRSLGHSVRCSHGARWSLQQLLSAEDLPAILCRRPCARCPHSTRLAPSSPLPSPLKQYDDIFSKPLNLKRITPKPDPVAQAAVEGATKVPFSDVYAKPRTKLFFDREFTAKV